MNDNLSASFILMAGAGLLAYWFYHLTGEQRKALLAKARAVPSDLPSELKPYVPQATEPANGAKMPGYDDAARQGTGYFPQQRGGY
jgi:hypothetical protein